MTFEMLLLMPSFVEIVFKVGATRRFDFYERIRELGDACCHSGNYE